MSSTAIEWTDRTWNPTTGCDRISPGCRHCYALTAANRLQAMGARKYRKDGDPTTSGPGFALTMHPDTVTDPLLKWPRSQRQRVFVDSMSDAFHAHVTPEFLGTVFATIALTPGNTYQLLTKRTRRMRILMATGGRVHTAMIETLHTLRSDPRIRRRIAHEILFDTTRDTTWPLPNLWLGTSIESDAYCGRADDLRATPAATRFLSCEPLLGPLPNLDLTGIDQVIVGGESGSPHARPMHPDWARHLRDICLDSGTAFFFKQWGSWAPADPGSRERALYVTCDGTIEHDRRHPPQNDPGHALMVHRHKKINGRILDGRTWDGYPADDVH